MNIGVDIDDVIADLIPSVIDFFNEKLGTSFTKEDFFSQDYASVMKKPEKETHKLMSEYIEDGHLEKLIPLEGSREALKDISNKHKIYAVTSRIPPAEKSTRTWLDKHFKGVFEDIHYSLNSYVNTDRKLTKKEICLNLEVDVMVEDDVGYATLFEDCGINVILFDQPWNRSFNDKEHHHIKRVSEWSEIPKVIASLGK